MKPTKVSFEFDERSRESIEKLKRQGDYPAILEQVADVVLAYRPKSRQPKPHKRKKAKRR
jgi:hypothetical protein